ncbi:uncharacterized protein FMAN_06475 [Fusarium mangiferae]|uniref:Uncharacterized protein n=1 Tax=Fusarium mangiferae TaxID=192010 RepID=A0A1L7SQQ9_FUSMA|nr:uncharacterized protein FMAN_06475 [Fusarium mangiferae]CVK86154.1 uncharacterized protein FMAN_06475 [Fusarium mangiferae]
MAPSSTTMSHAHSGAPRLRTAILVLKPTPITGAAAPLKNAAVVSVTTERDSIKPGYWNGLGGAGRSDHTGIASYDRTWVFHPTDSHPGTA